LSRHRIPYGECSYTQSAGYAIASAANLDGTEVAALDANGLNMYDGNFNLIGPLHGSGIRGLALFGGLLFSPDNSTLYEKSMPTDISAIYSVNAKTPGVRGLPPAMPFMPVQNDPSDKLSFARNTSNEQLN